MNGTKELVEQLRNYGEYCYAEELPSSALEKFREAADLIESQDKRIAELEVSLEKLRKLLFGGPVSEEAMAWADAEVARIVSYPREQWGRMIAEHKPFARLRSQVEVKIKAADDAREHAAYLAGMEAARDIARAIAQRCRDARDRGDIKGPELNAYESACEQTGDEIEAAMGAQAARTAQTPLQTAPDTSEPEKRARGASAGQDGA